MEACLLHNLSHQEYQEAINLSLKHCEVIASLAKLKLPFNETSKPGELLIKTLDRRGYSVRQYREFLKVARHTKVIHTYFKPQSKIAVLIANDKYINLAKLATPSMDCDSLRSILKNLGFIVITIKNCLSEPLQDIIEKVFSVIPEKSYCFIFYAGHGCEICNTKFILDVQCPTENITLDNCITENFILGEVAKCKPELCVLIMDMCRIHLDRETNNQIYASLPTIDQYSLENITNLLVTYSTQSEQAAYEVLQIECSTTINNEDTYMLKTGDTDKIVPGASQYVNALCSRIEDDLDISSLLDKVHGDVENSMKKQRPIKVQCGVAKRSVYDPVKGDTTEILHRLIEIGAEFGDVYSVI